MSAMELSVFGAAETVSDALAARPSMAAVTVVAPGATAVTFPAALTMAIAEFASVQVTDAVTSAVELSV